MSRPIQLTPDGKGTILAIDPGPTQSAFLVYGSCRGESPKIISHGKWFNRSIVEWLPEQPDSKIVLEMIGHYGSGMPAGKEVFETCVWIGRFMQAAGSDRVVRVLRPTVKTQICGTPRANDANVRQALIDRFGGKEKAIGKKKTPGPLFGVAGDVWAALAVAVAWTEQKGLMTTV